MGTPIDHALGGSLYTVDVLARMSLVTLLLQTTVEMRSNVGGDLSLSLFELEAARHGRLCLAICVLRLSVTWIWLRRGSLRFIYTRGEGGSSARQNPVGHVWCGGSQQLDTGAWEDKA